MHRILYTQRFYIIMYAQKEATGGTKNAKNSMNLEKLAKFKLEMLSLVKFEIKVKELKKKKKSKRVFMYRCLSQSSNKQVHTYKNCDLKRFSNTKIQSAFIKGQHKEDLV